MGTVIFFDTNIFIYAVSLAPEDADRQRIANRLIEAGDFALSLQVIQEFIDVCSRKKRIGRSGRDLRESVEALLAFPLACPTPDLVLRALDLQERHQLRYWDAAILAAAHALGCSTLYTEDLNHGQNYDGVRVVNPFL